MLRIAHLESGLLTTCLNEALDTSGRLFIGMSQDLVGDGDITITQAQNRAYALAEGFHRMTTSKISNTWPLFMRYKVLTEREYRRALEDFDRLKALRHELPNEPIIDDQPEPIATAYDPSPADPIPLQDAPLTPPAAQEPGIVRRTDKHTGNRYSEGPPPTGDLGTAPAQPAHTAAASPPWRGNRDAA
jgi:hypothetical protein